VPINNYGVPPCSFAIHADRDAVAGERAGEGRTGELRALVGSVVQLFLVTLPNTATRAFST
jgi:hypothetical protein